MRSVRRRIRRSADARSARRSLPAHLDRHRIRVAERPLTPRVEPSASKLSSPPVQACPAAGTDTSAPRAGPYHPPYAEGPTASHDGSARPAPAAQPIRARFDDHPAAITPTNVTGLPAAKPRDRSTAPSGTARRRSAGTRAFGRSPRRVRPPSQTNPRPSLPPGTC